jgi:hypothetical protein
MHKNGDSAKIVSILLTQKRVRKKGSKNVPLWVHHMDCIKEKCPQTWIMNLSQADVRIQKMKLVVWLHPLNIFSVIFICCL